MGGKFEVHTEVSEPASRPDGRYHVTRDERCISCGECTRVCIYGVHVREDDDPRAMADPISEICRACLVCVQQCPRRALEVDANPGLEEIGTPPYDADTVLTAWQEATDGKIPVRGAGYAGRFRGEGFDGIWTDMSEIVRPTRDGIHGREYISTEFDLGRKLPDLSGLRFDDEGRLLDRIPLTREIPVPMMFGRLPLGPGGLRVSSILMRAAMELKTFAMADLQQLAALREPEVADELDQRAVRYLRENRNHAVVHLDDRCFGADGKLAPPASDGGIFDAADLVRSAAVISLADGPELQQRVTQLRGGNPDLLVIVDLPATPRAAQRAAALAGGPIDAIHLTCHWQGRWADGQGDPTSVTEAIRETHLALVAAGLRDQLTLLASGGIARAEHLPKAILLGADAVVLDVPLLLALECRVCQSCTADGRCALDLDQVSPKWGARRVVNLMSSWRNQLLEVLGAMGMREVRRLRGEVGRGLFADDLEKEFFEDLTDLGEDDTPLPAPGADVRVPGATLGSRMRSAYGPFRVSRTEACERCGRCVDVCTRGVLRWPGGLREPPPPVEEACVGADCGDGCEAACPSGAIRVEPDHRLGVNENHRWTHDLVVETWNRATGLPPVAHGSSTSLGDTDGGFDLLELVPGGAPVDPADVDLSLDLNRRDFGPRIRLPLPFYGGGMSYGSVSREVMTGRSRAAQELGTFTCTGEGGFPEQLTPYADHIITQVATGYFGVSEKTIQQTRMVEFKYAQGAKPGLGGHLLGDKNTPTVAKLREAVPGTALFSPFPFHSVYSIEDHRKHVDWVRQINPDLLVSVKVSTPGDVDMVAVGSYHAGANIVHLDGSYGGTGAAPEVAKKNIAMPIELALSRTHRFLEGEGIRDEVVLMASGGVRTPMDMVKAVALGADGVVVGTSELIAIECVLCRNCEKDRGCPRGIATTDTELQAHLDADWVHRRIVNMARCWVAELRWILGRLGIPSVAALRGRSDLIRLRGRVS